jgi:CRISPR-associated protein Csm3
MYGKVVIECKLTALTGMHIGGSSTFSSIGSVNSPVIRDAWSGAPYIPGSSLKGKLRTLLAKAEKQNYITQECKDDPPEIARLFGSAAERNKPFMASRLQFADAFLTNSEDLKRLGGYTEIKFENTISRLTGMANPRQIERIVRGAQFAVKLVYDVQESHEVMPDFHNISRALKLMSMDYLGGHGSRGYGRVGFSEFHVAIRDGECPISASELEQILKDVEEYGLFHLQA